MRSTAGIDYLAVRPLLADYVMSMPRGAAVIYPRMQARSSRMPISSPAPPSRPASGRERCRCPSSGRSARGGPPAFLRTPGGFRRDRQNARAFFGIDHPAWTVTVGDLVETLPRPSRPGTVDRVVLDMLARGECLGVVGDALLPGRVVICLCRDGRPTLPGRRDCATAAGSPPRVGVAHARLASRGLAVRPQHRMHGHTGFLITARSPGITPPLRKRRPGKGYVTDLDDTQEWTEEDFGERVRSEAGAAGRPVGGCASPRSPVTAS